MGIVSVAKLEVSEAEKNMLIMYANVSPIRTTVLLEISFGWLCHPVENNFFKKLMLF